MSLSRKAMLELELEEAAAAEQIAELKASRPTCPECGRLLRERQMTKKQKTHEKQLRQAKLDHREKRRRVREARSG